MKKLAFSALLISFSTFLFAGHHENSSESEVLKALSTYMDARNSRDFKTVVDMSSKSGTLDTNSDGSFHKPLTQQSVDDWKKSGEALTQYFFPEATMIAEGVVHVRFYFEHAANRIPCQALRRL